MFFVCLQGEAEEKAYSTKEVWMKRSVLAEDGRFSAVKVGMTGGFIYQKVLYTIYIFVWKSICL